MTSSLQAADPILLSCQAVGYQVGANSSKPILDDISLTIERGKITTIIGPNGAGKTTLLKILLGFLKPTSGHVHQAASLKIGYMPQRLSLSPLIPITVERFLELSVPSQLDSSAIDQSLSEVGALAVRKSQLSKLSGGEMQRVLLARALIINPDLLVLDEPDQGIDVLGQADLYRLIAQIRDHHACGIILVSHDLHVVMASSDMVICLNTHICCSGHPQAVLTNPHYINLFGPHGAQALQELASYTHHHDHCHETVCQHD